MSLKHGLNLKKASSLNTPARRAPTLLADADSDSDSAPPRPLPTTATTKPPTAHLPAEPDIFDYDSYHDAAQAYRNKIAAAKRKAALNREAQYFPAIQAAAEQRKKDQAIARDRILAKEREAEGDEFKDKEVFVTDAWRKRKEEVEGLRKLEEGKIEEKEGDVVGFMKGLKEDEDRVFREREEEIRRIMAAPRVGVAIEGGGEEKEEEQPPVGKIVERNDEGQVVDKRELLDAGLNVAVKKNSNGAEHLRAKNVERRAVKDKNLHVRREKQSQMIEEQLREKEKRKREEEEEERLRIENAAKSRKKDTEISDAKRRYLERKAMKEKEKEQTAA